jgi:MbtH protein
MTDRANGMRNAVANPFEDPDTLYLVIANDEGQHSLWPVSSRVPAGWAVLHEADTRSHCVDYIEENWTDMRPLSLVRSARA